MRCCFLLSGTHLRSQLGRHDRGRLDELETLLHFEGALLHLVLASCAYRAVVPGSKRAVAELIATWSGTLRWLRGIRISWRCGRSFRGGWNDLRYKLDSSRRRRVILSDSIRGCGMRIILGCAHLSSGLLFLPPLEVRFHRSHISLSPLSLLRRFVHEDHLGLLVLLAR